MMSKDKLYHFIAGLVICIVFAIFTDPITALGASVGAGVLKECYDHYNDKPFDVYDMLATWCGWACGFALVTMLKYWGIV